MSKARIASAISVALITTAIALAHAGFHALAEDKSPKDKDADKPNLSFKWTIAARLDSLGGNEIIPINEDATLYSGDVLKIYLNPGKNAYIYAYFVEPTNEVKVLFPASPDDFKKNPAAVGKRYIPAGGEWFLPKQGKTIIFLLASTERLSRLEELTKKFIATSSPGENRTGANPIIAEIKSIKRKNSKFAAEPEKPLEIAGTYRNVYVPSYPRDADIETFATQIEAANFFSKTITVEYK